VHKLLRCLLEPVKRSGAANHVPWRVGTLGMWGTSSATGCPEWVAGIALRKLDVFRQRVRWRRNTISQISCPTTFEKGI
jgi:hypothetical protein